MSEHLTRVRTVEHQIQASCPEHGSVGKRQMPTMHGWRAVAAEARAHDDMVHGVYRTSGAWASAMCGDDDA